MAHVEKVLPPDHWVSVVHFIHHMLGINCESTPSVDDIGEQITSSTDKSRQRGAYQGRMGAIAETLNQAYLNWARLDRRRNSWLAASRAIKE